MCAPVPTRAGPVFLSPPSPTHPGEPGARGDVRARVMCPRGLGLAVCYATPGAVAGRRRRRCQMRVRSARWPAGFLCFGDKEGRRGCARGDQIGPAAGQGVKEGTDRPAASRPLRVAAGG